MGAPLSSHWPLSRHGPGGDVLGHRGPAFLQTVTSHWPGEQEHSRLVSFPRGAGEQHLPLKYLSHGLTRWH